jgi:hypothetical protein
MSEENKNKELKPYESSKGKQNGLEPSEVRVDLKND